MYWPDRYPTNYSISLLQPGPQVSNTSVVRSMDEPTIQGMVKFYPHAFDNETRAAANGLIDDIQALNNDWDGYGAEKINAATVVYAKRVLELLPHSLSNPDITPNSNGTISFEWETSEAKAHLELGKTKFSVYVKPAFGRPFFAEGKSGYFDIDIARKMDALLFIGNSYSVGDTNSVGDYRIFVVGGHAQFRR